MMIVAAHKSNIEIAKEVLSGKWGSDTYIKRRLMESGYNYTKILEVIKEIKKQDSAI